MLYVKHMVVTKSVSSNSTPVSTKTFCKSVRIMSCNKPVVFLLFTSIFALVIVLVKLFVAVLAVNLLVPWSVLNLLNLSLRANSFVFVNYCSVNCTELPVKVISSTVRKSLVSCRTACPAEFDNVVQTVNNIY